MNKPAFFNLSLRQPVNQWLGMGLILAMCFWVVIYYYVNSTEIVSSKILNIAQTTNSSDITN